MRLIGSLADRQQAETFIAFLITEGVQSHLEPEGDEFEIWIKDEDFVARAVDELNSFQSEPDDSKYSEAIPRAKEMQSEQIKKRQRIAKNLVNVSGGQIQRNHRLTIFLMVLCGVVAIFTNFGSTESQIQATFRALAFNGVAPPHSIEIWMQNGENPDSWNIRLASVRNGEAWRLITPIFLHFGVFHLVFNMYMLFVFGSQIENRYGTMWYGILIIVAAIISNFVQCVVPMDIGGAVAAPHGGYLITKLGGMSGVVYALFGFILMRMTYDRSSGLFIPQSTVFFLLGWLIFCMTPVATEVFDLHVANWVHAIGMLVGLVAGYWPTMIPTRPKAT